VVELYYDAKLSALHTGHHARTMLQRVGRVYRWNEHTRKGVRAIYARWDKFDFRREMEMAVERALCETLADKPAAAAIRTAA
jgi:hypothetical protein